MNLYIDTTKSKIKVVLIGSNYGIAKKTSWQSSRNDSLKLLRNIDKLLIRSGVKSSDLKTIFVNRGLGPYTTLRVGVSIANALAYSLNIPIFSASSIDEVLKLLESKKTTLSGFENPVTPKYMQPVHITKRKARR